MPKNRINCLTFVAEFGVFMKNLKNLTTTQNLIEEHKINIAIDGFAACGKSTLAKALAKRLGYAYIDSGAMYRAATHYFQQQNIDIEDIKLVDAALPDVHIHFQNTPKGNRTYLNNVDVEEEIRTMLVSSQVSEVSTIHSVRDAMVAQQQRMGTLKGVVMDGRDIGTVVFPTAELKIFMTADVAVRVQRRQAELAAKGVELSAEEVEKNLRHRDRIDTTRAYNPMRQAADAVVLDNSKLTPEEQIEIIVKLAKERI